MKNQAATRGLIAVAYPVTSQLFQTISKRRRRIYTAVLGVTAACSPLRAQTSTYVGPDNGLWTTAGSWSPAGEPSGDDVVLGTQSAGTTDLHVTFNDTSGTHGMNSLTLNSSALAGYMIVNQTDPASSLSTLMETVGTTISENEFNQAAGNDAVNELDLGESAGSSSNYYNLSGNAGLSCEGLEVGVSGGGTFNQSGGTYQFPSDLHYVPEVNIGANAGSYGTYNLSAGTIVDTFNGAMNVGLAGSGTFNMTGGIDEIPILNVGGSTGTGVVNFSGGVLGRAATGTTTVGSNGTFIVGAGGTLYGSITVATGGLLDMQGGSIFNPIMSGGTLRLDGNSLTISTLQGSGIVEGTNGSQTLTMTTNGGLFAGTLRDGATGTLSIAVNVNQGDLPSIETLSGISNYSGSTLVQSGTLQAGSLTAFSPFSAVTVSGSGALDLNGFNSTILSLAGTGGTVSIGGGTTLSTGGAGTLLFTSYSGAITGNGTIQKTGLGNFSLAGNNLSTFSGTISVLAGELLVGAVNGIPVASTVNLGSAGTLAVNFDQGLAGLAGGGGASVNFFFTGSTLTVGGDNSSSSYQGGFVGVGQLTKVGSGVFTIGGGGSDTNASNTDTSLTINETAGTLLLNKADGTNAIGGLLNIGGGTVLYARGNQIADTTGVTLNAGTLNLAGFNDTIGGLAGAGGNVALSGGTLTINQSVNTTYSGVLGGPGLIVKSGVGNLTFSSSSTFAGSFTVNAGQLILTGAVNATGLIANGGGTLELLGASLSLNGGSIQSNAGAVQYSNATVTNGYIRGAVSHTILNNGTTTFNAITTYNSTVINQNGPATFNNFTGGGTLNNNMPLTLSGAILSTSSIFNVNNSVSMIDFTSDGVINISSTGSIFSGNTSYFGGGSRTYIAASSTLSAAPGTTIELNGALLSNSGTVNAIVDVNFGSLATGTGSYLAAVNVNPGGTYAPGVYGQASVLANTSSTLAFIQPAANGVNTNTAAGVSVNADAFITVNGTDVLTLSGGLNAVGYAVTKVGTGTVTVAPFSANSLNVSSGVLQLSVTHPAAVLSVGTLAVGGGAKLDVGNNGVDVSAEGLSAISSLVASGYADGSWTGTGIDSTTAAADTNHLTGLGVIQNNQGGSPLFSALNLFDGTIPSPGDILVKYTYYGDSNLDGKVDGSDYTRIDNGYLSRMSPTPLAGWFNGDFNYDGVVDGSDYTLIDNAFNSQGSQLTAAIAVPTAGIADASGNSAVPEPANLALLGIATAGIFRRYRRSQKP